MFENTPSFFKNIRETFRNNRILESSHLRLDFTSKDEFLVSVVNSDFIAADVKKEISLLLNGIEVITSEKNPVLKVDGTTGMVIFDLDAQEWLNILTPHEEKINKMISSAGRIEWDNQPRYPSPSYYLGTGFLLKGTSYVITNKHVANNFVDEVTFKFKIDPEHKHRYKPRIDFLEEEAEDEIMELEAQLKGIKYLSTDPTIDLAIFEIDLRTLESTIDGLELSSIEPRKNSSVAAIGYPNNLSNYKHDKQERDNLFKSFKYKRVSPGHIVKRELDLELLRMNKMDENRLILHTCSTIEGNSGSPIIDIETGQVVGLHLSGIYKKYNFALKSTTILQILNSL